MNYGSRSITAGLLALLPLALLAISGCSGKGAEGSCGATATCGGDPTGTWTVAGACQFHADQPYQDVSLVEEMQAPLTPSLAPPQEEATTTGSWCSQLVFLPPNSTTPGVKDVTLWHDAPALTTGTVEFDASGSYSTTLNFATVSTTHFAPACLQSAGANPSCDDLAQGLTTFYVNSAMARGVTGGPTPTPGFEAIQCLAASDQGCDCYYDYKVVLTDQGTWAKGDNIITEANTLYLYNGQAVKSQAPTGPMEASFCQSGDQQLTLSGYAGTSLSAAVGLRTLSLQKSP